MLFDAAVKAVDPFLLVSANMAGIRERIRHEGITRVHFASFGKAACPMAAALEDSLGPLIAGGIAITKYGHQGSCRSSKARLFEAGHPVPDERGVAGTAEALRLLEGCREDTLLICLISGGGSALLVAPREGISLEEKQKTTDLLMKAGADINELNTVRKHLSRVKGGRLAGLAHPAGVHSLILSDVPGDRLDVIASGPTSPDPTTFDDALDVLERYELAGSVPLSVKHVLEKGRDGLIPETPKPGAPIFERVRNIIIGSNRIAIRAAEKKARDLGLTVRSLYSSITGEARTAGAMLAGEALKIRESAGIRRPVAIISGGETTVTVRGPGLGGRNTELALAFAIQIGGVEGITLLSAGTDGTDGPTDAAGAIVDGTTVSRARAAGADPMDYLDRNDSYHFFERTGDLLMTGPTGTNVMDLQIVVIS